MSDLDKSMTGRTSNDTAKSLGGYRMTTFGVPQGEIDLRAEFNSLMYGDENEVKRGRWLVVWVANPRVRVAGWNVTAGHYDEPRQSLDHLQSGFMHTESLVRGRIGWTGGQEEMANFGRIIAPTAFIYVEYNVFPSPKVAQLSEVWELNLDNDGEILYEEEGVYPYLRRWNVRQAVDFREDGGKNQYWRLHCERQDI